MNPLGLLKEIRDGLKDVLFEIGELRADLKRVIDVLDYPIVVSIEKERKYW